MAKGKLMVTFRGAITLQPELRTTKSGKLVLGVNCACSRWSPTGPKSVFVTVNFWGGQAQTLYNKFVSGEHQVGDIMHVDNGDLEIYTYKGRDDTIKSKILLTPSGQKREQRDASGKPILKEDGTPATEWWGDYEITPGSNHVWQSDAVVPEPKEERQAVPPAGYVDVSEDGPLPWEE